VRGSRSRLRLPFVGRSLRARLALTFAVAVLPLAGVAGLAVARLHAGNASRREAAAVARLAALVQRATDARSAASLSPRVEAALVERRSFQQPARAQANGLARRWSAARRERFRSGLAPVRRAMVDLALAEVRQQRAAATPAAWELVAAIAAALLLGALAVWRLGALLLRPLRRLQEAAALLGHERLGLRVPVERDDEIGDLARSVNELADRLASARRELSSRAEHDPLTLLPNRSVLGERVAEALEHRRRVGRPVVLLWVGVDNLDDVRGSLGAEYGDRVLRALAERVSSCIRSRDLVARVGGEAFAVLVDDVATVEDAVPCAERILAALRRRPEGDVVVRASVGIAAADSRVREPDDLFRAASLAMQAAKAQGGDRHAFFAEEMQVQADDRLSLEADLREAIERGRLTLDYQPLFDLRAGAICGLEALVRWRHPERGPISPGVFVPLAEATGLIEPLGLWVLGEACADTLRLERQGIRVPVGVNLSRRQLDQSRLVDDVGRILREQEFDATRLVLEVTETAVAEDTGSAVARLAELRALGIRIALDDFGTGYSSLGSLRALPIDIVKIDRSFVSGLREDDPASLEFVRTVVDLGRALGLRTVAEGIEEEEQVRILRQLHCDEGQGFHLGRPMELARVGQLLAHAA
jgi:diguanylate cyclase (GGDEF)-like protein